MAYARLFTVIIVAFEKRLIKFKYHIRKTAAAYNIKNVVKTKRNYSQLIATYL